MSLWCDGSYVTPEGYYVIKVITRLLHQGISRLLRHDDVDQSQTASKSADFRCEKIHFCSSESRESRIFGIIALKTIVSKNKTELFSTCNWSIIAPAKVKQPLRRPQTKELQRGNGELIEVMQLLGEENVG